ncbi:MAG: ATP-binding protein [Oligoflexales bacterium]|nr:ATP-binding protein [Oligoflexales bacterium]
MNRRNYFEIINYISLYTKHILFENLLGQEICDITLTGSNAHLLSSELATLIAGRYVEFKIYPLTFKEFLKFRKKVDVKSELKDEFQLFLKYGGLPAIHSFELSDDNIFHYLNSIYHTVLLKDVIMRHSLKEPAHLERIVRFIFSNCGNITTAKRISDYLKNQKILASVDKVLNYVS